LASWPVLVC